MLKNFLNENQIIVPSYQYYGGMSGFQDYGIFGFQIKNRLINLWREFFTGQDVHEVEIPTIMPHDILKASGHVDRFFDYVVYDRNGACFRADHRVKNFCRENNMSDIADRVDAMTAIELEEIINKHKMIDVDYARVVKKNLMVEVPSNTLVQNANPDFLRPELAQGIFVNFNTYMAYLQDGDDFHQFGIAQIGKSYRKEISPQPFIRMREFTQAEIEYFVNPGQKTHPEYIQYCDTEIPILTQKMQTDGVFTPQKIYVRDAVSNNMISHELMGYFLAKIYLFAKKIGLHEDKIRFRQHLSNEMAHYASQCWDLECLVMGSWLECVGCADRGCYDLTAHGIRNQNQPFTAKTKLSNPYNREVLIIKPNAKYWRGDMAKYIDKTKKYLANLDNDTLMEINNALVKSEVVNMYADGNSVYLSLENLDKPKITECTKDMFTISKETHNITHETFIPNVVEPSFGIDRLMYAVLEQNIWFREQDINKGTNEPRRAVLSLVNQLCPYDVAVFPLHKKDKMIEMAKQIRTALILQKYKCYIDDSGTSIGKRYTRADELGVKHVITVDPGTLDTGIVTIRNRDSMQQITIHYNDILKWLAEKN